MKATKAKKDMKKGVFIVQQHPASPLHYNFQLDAGTASKSWVVPHGPSAIVYDTRVAVEKEDSSEHSNDIAAGPIWDKGIYKLEAISANNDTFHSLKQYVKKGRLMLTLEGKHLKGTFSLIRTKGYNWLFVKTA